LTFIIRSDHPTEVFAKGLDLKVKQEGDFKMMTSVLSDGMVRRKEKKRKKREKEEGGYFNFLSRFTNISSCFLATKC
jgi:hypothetical protein